MFEKLLGLGDGWEVVLVQFDQQEGKGVIEVKGNELFWQSLRGEDDREEGTCYDHTERMIWRPLNAFEYRCEIPCRLPRGKATKSGKVFRIRPPWEGLSKYFSMPFEAFALVLLREMPVKKAAEILGETDTRLWRMMHRQAHAAYAQADFSLLKGVGCDELSRHKGHHYVSVFADMLKKRAFLLGKARTKARGIDLRRNCLSTGLRANRERP